MNSAPASPRIRTLLSLARVTLLTLPRSNVDHASVTQLPLEYESPVVRQPSMVFASCFPLRLNRYLSQPFGRFQGGHRLKERLANPSAVAVRFYERSPRNRGGVSPNPSLQRTTPW